MTSNVDRLTTAVSPHAKAALKRMARHYATTQRAVLERLLTQAEGDLWRKRR